MTITKAEFERRCYHEAGHAVVALVLGADVEEITTSYVRANVSGDNDVQIAVTRCIIKVAGLVSERIKYGRANVLTFALADYSQAEKIAGEIGMEFKPRMLEKQARNILTDKWYQVERIATELLNS